MRTKGKIALWNDDKGYGFIAPLDGGKQIFVHVSALSNRARRPQLSDVISYSVSKDKQGRPCAVNATLAGDKLVKKSPGKSSAPATSLAVAFLAGIGIATALGYFSRIYLTGYAGLSLVTFVTYAIDKSAARRGGWRVSEEALLISGLAGGWPGALIAQQVLRHKSKKTSFRIMFWTTVLINCAGLVWLHTGR